MMATRSPAAPSERQWRRLAIAKDRTRIDYAIRELRSVESPIGRDRVRQALATLQQLDCLYVRALVEAGEESC